MSDVIKNAAPFVPNIGSMVNGNVLRAALFGTIILAVAIIILLIVRARKNKGCLHIGTKKVAASAVSILLVVLIVCNVSVLGV